MSLLGDLKLTCFPPHAKDPVLGDLVFVFLKDHPEQSYWHSMEAYKDPALTVPDCLRNVCVYLPGTAEGMNPRAHEFCVSLPAQWDRLLAIMRPKLEEIFQQYLQQPLPADPFSALQIEGVDISNMEADPFEWQLDLATTGEVGLDITLPFLGDAIQAPVVETDT